MDRLTARPRVYEDAAAAIRRYIAQERLRPGDPLPPEREIQHQLGISRASVREALRILQMTGLVEARHGKGLFVKEMDLQPMVRALTSNIELIDGVGFRQLFEVRKALELELADLAARQRTADDLADFAECLASMGQAIQRNDVEAALAEDLRFHEHLVRVARNPLLERLYSSIAAFLVEIRTISPQTGENLTSCLEEHNAIFQAIRDQDPSRAIRLMHDHLEGLSDFPTESVGAHLHQRPTGADPRVGI